MYFSSSLEYCLDRQLAIRLKSLERNSNNRGGFTFAAASAETSAPRTPQPGGGGAQKGGPVTSQYVVLFNQRMIKVL